MRVKAQKQALWWWVVPILLLMSALAVPKLAFDGLWYDELYSIRNSGGSLYGPLGPMGIVERVVETDPYQALGYPLLLAGWGWFTGWTAFATRVSSWLLGALTVAVCYRLGCVALGKRGGVYTALIMAVSAFFIHFNHELRTYTLLTLSACTLIWAYVYLLQTKNDKRLVARVGFVMSGAALLWGHYYSAILLLGLGAYHVLFAAKNRRWWKITGTAMLVGVLFLPQLPGFLNGFASYQPENLGVPALTTPEILQTLLYYSGNGLGVITLVLLACGLWQVWREGVRSALGAIVGVAILSASILVVANALLEILEPRRIRYAITILPLTAVWLAGGMLAIEQWVRGRVSVSQSGKLWWVLLILPMVWLVNGVMVNSQEAFTDSLEAEPIPRLRSIVTEIDGRVGSTDLLAFYSGDGGDSFYMQEIFALAIDDLAVPAWMVTSTLYTDETATWAQGLVDEADRIWYGVNRTIERNDIHTRFVSDLEQQFVLCGSYVDAADLSLALWARYDAYCPITDDAAQIQYGDAFTLEQTEVTLMDDTLVVRQGWAIASDAEPARYSLGTYLVNPENEAIVLQADTGFPVAGYFAAESMFEIADVPSGNYEVRVVVYAWESGVRLDGETAESVAGNYLTVGRVRIP